MFPAEPEPGLITQTSRPSVTPITQWFLFRWYRANYSMAQRLDWGRGKGCDFAMKSCKFWMDQQSRRKENVSPFCNTLRGNPLRLTCRQDQKAVAICNLHKFPRSLPQEYQV
ncbi:hypothetical protein GDO81_028138 [Engystomops pustulosus]|uniref:Leishmanolysin-like peptidase n=1 Tax=Engystomops pustulosus TaxID=76066 RepID=A0AAV6ZJ52_ENGPU|nr:hypothetical protein GDO81_028138 [Engystomops pustulosus]